LGGWGRGCLLFCNIFEGDLGELVFQHNFCLFYEIRKLKEEKEGGKEYKVIKNVLLVILEEIFYMRSVSFFSGFFLQFFNLKNLILTYAKDCMYIC